MIKKAILVRRPPPKIWKRANHNPKLGCGSQDSLPEGGPFGQKNTAPVALFCPSEDSEILAIFSEPPRDIRIA